MIQQLTQLKIQSVNFLPLDSNSKVQHTALVNGWGVISIKPSLIFIKIKDPSIFKIYQQMEVQRLIHLSQDLMLVVKYNEIYLFELSDNKIFLRFIYLTNFLNLHSITSCVNKSLVLAGVDLRQNIVADIKYYNKRYFYFVKNLTMFFKKLKEQKQQRQTIQKKLLYDQKMLILTLKQSSQSPIQHISIFLQDRLILSVFERFMFIHNLQTGQKLSQLNLNNQINKVIPIPYLFNIYNVLLHTKQNQLIRVGVQINGQQIGCQLEKIQDKVQGVVRLQHMSQEQNEQKHKIQQQMTVIVLKTGQLFEYNFLTKKQIKCTQNEQNKNCSIVKLPDFVYQKDIKSKQIMFLKDQIIVKQMKYISFF